MEVVFFTDQFEFRQWLEENHQKEKELVAGFYRKSTGKPTMTWPESVDQALCFGWIDGIRRKIDDESYCIRFTPRNPSSTWSALNVKKAIELIKKGLMQPAGLSLFMNRKEEKTAIYSYENKPEALPDYMQEKFKQSKEAWDFFSAQPPSYRRTVYFWILSAKRKETQLARLEKIIRECELKKRLT
jgi:uncharacterized protein YdeI (YjbR/CyaY-like superfamily)